MLLNHKRQLPKYLINLLLLQKIDYYCWFINNIITLSAGIVYTCRVVVRQGSELTIRSYAGSMRLARHAQDQYHCIPFSSLV